MPEGVPAQRSCHLHFFKDCEDTDFNQFTEKNKERNRKHRTGDVIKRGNKVRRGNHPPSLILTCLSLIFKKISVSFNALPIPALWSRAYVTDLHSHLQMTHENGWKTIIFCAMGGSKTGEKILLSFCKMDITHFRLTTHKTLWSMWWYKQQYSLGLALWSVFSISKHLTKCLNLNAYSIPSSTTHTMQVSLYGS